MEKITLILLPGMDGTGELFAPFIEALGETFEIKIVTYPMQETMGYDELEAIAGSAVPSDHPYIIVGESFSGPIAVSLAASAPQNLKALVLCCTFVSNPRPTFSRLSFLIDYMPISLAQTPLLTRFLLGKFSNTSLQELFKQVMSCVSLSVLRARLKAVLSINVTTKLAAIRIPILYLRASSDHLVPKAASVKIAQICPHTKVVDINASHFLLQVAPIAAAEAVKTFIHHWIKKSTQSNLSTNGPSLAELQNELLGCGTNIPEEPERLVF